MQRLVAPDMRGGWRGHGAVLYCHGLSDQVKNPAQHRFRFRGTPKVLVQNSLYDPATGYEWAVGVHRQTKQTSVLLTYEGWGHGVYWRSECTRAATNNYLTALQLPTVSRCAAVEPVF
ncbi:alpha/beta hydrolase [Kibdelosporangium philippinense]